MNRKCFSRFLIGKLVIGITKLLICVCIDFFFFFFVYQKYDEGVYQMLGFFMGSVEYVKYKIILGPYK